MTNRYTYGRDELGPEATGEWEPEDAPLCDDCRMPVEYAYCPSCGEALQIRTWADDVLTESARLLDERDADMMGGDPICCAECESGLRGIYDHTYRTGCRQRVRELYAQAAEEATIIARAMLRMLTLHQALIDEMGGELLEEVGHDPYVTAYPFRLSLDEVECEVGAWADLLEARGDGSLI